MWEHVSTIKHSGDNDMYFTEFNFNYLFNILNIIVLFILKLFCLKLELTNKIQLTFFSPFTTKVVIPNMKKFQCDHSFMCSFMLGSVVTGIMLRYT